MSHACNKTWPRGCRRHALGFTFVEILVALSVVLIALVPLIRLHVVSIRQIDSAARVAKATLLANAKLAEATAQEVVELGKSRGRVDDGDLGVTFHWRLTVTDAHPLESEEVHLIGIKHVRVDVVWQDGRRTETVSLDTLVDVVLQSQTEIVDSKDEDRRRTTTTIPGSNR